MPPNRFDETLAALITLAAGAVWVTLVICTVLLAWWWLLS